MGQDAEGVAGVQHSAGFGRTKAHLVHIRLLDDLHLGDFVGKVAPVGLQVDDGPQLGGAEVREVRACMPADKDRAVLAGQHAVTLGSAACTAAELGLAVAPIEVAVNVGSLDPDAAQLIAVLDAVAGIQGSGYLFRTLGGGRFGGKAFVFGLLCGLGRSLTGSAGRFFFGSAGRFFFGCAGGGLAGRSCFGGLLLVFRDDERRRDADAHGQRQRTEDQPYDEPSAAGHAWWSRLAR